MKYWRTPLDKERVKPICGQVHVITDRCKGCGFCIKFCPRNVLQESKEFNQKGYHYPCVAKPEACAACGLCEMICPDFAISVVPFEEMETSCA